MVTGPFVFLEYKCRHCNEVFNSVRVTEDKAALDFEDLIFNGKTARLFDTHTCKDGHTGLADLTSSTPAS